MTDITPTSVDQLLDQVEGLMGITPGASSAPTPLAAPSGSGSGPDVGSLDALTDRMFPTTATEPATASASAAVPATSSTPVPSGSPTTPTLPAPSPLPSGSATPIAGDSCSPIEYIFFTNGEEVLKVMPQNPEPKNTIIFRGFYDQYGPINKTVFAMYVSAYTSLTGQYVGWLQQRKLLNRT